MTCGGGGGSSGSCSCNDGGDDDEGLAAGCDRKTADIPTHPQRRERQQHDLATTLDHRREKPYTDLARKRRAQGARVLVGSQAGSSMSVACSSCHSSSSTFFPPTRQQEYHHHHYYSYKMSRHANRPLLSPLLHHHHLQSQSV